MKKGKTLYRERNITHLLFVIPNLVLYCMFTVLPLFIGVFYSLTNWNGISNDYDFIGLNNYISAFQDDRFTSAIRFNVIYAIMLMACVTVLSIILGLLLNAPIKGRSFFRTLYFFPSVVGMISIGLIFNQIFLKGIPQIAEALGIASLQTSILSSPKTAIFGILITNVWKSVALPTVMVISALQTIPGEIVESAQLDGANRWQEFRYITLPFVLPIVSVILVLTLKEGLMIYDYIVALTNGGPAGATESITMILYRQGFEEMKFSYSISQAIIVSVIIIVISFIQMKFTRGNSVYAD